MLLKNAWFSFFAAAANQRRVCVCDPSSIWMHDAHLHARILRVVMVTRMWKKLPPMLIQYSCNNAPIVLHARTMLLCEQLRKTCELQQSDIVRCGHEYEMCENPLQPKTLQFYCEYPTITSKLQQTTQQTQTSMQTQTTIQTVRAETILIPGYPADITQLDRTQ